jgi:hypothetical protein
MEAPWTRINLHRFAGEGHAIHGLRARIDASVETWTLLGQRNDPRRRSRWWQYHKSWGWLRNGMRPKSRGTVLGGRCRLLLLLLLLLLLIDRYHPRLNERRILEITTVWC